MKRIAAGFLSLALALSLTAGTPSAAAYTPRYTSEADILHELGLFNGTDKGYELERVPTRTEALVLLIRLLGRAADALNCAAPNPFADVPVWADRYVAWGYAQGLTKGVSGISFGGDAPAGAPMFMTLILRALGYDDSAGDFTYDTAVQKAADIGLVPAGSYQNATAGFYRDDCAHLCYAALTAKMSTGGQTLCHTLAAEGAVRADTARKYGLLPEKTSFTVACVGDSFTYGFGLKNPVAEAYPSVLATLTGDFSFTTENYSTPMVTVNYESHLAFSRTDEYKASLKTTADIILLVMGANDAIWTPSQTDLDEDFQQLLESYLALPQSPKVIVMTPPRLLGAKTFDAKMAEVVETERKVARDMKLDIIDIYAFSEGMEGYSSDNVHFNAEGHKLVAAYIYKELSGLLSK